MKSIAFLLLLLCACGVPIVDTEATDVLTLHTREGYHYYVIKTPYGSIPSWNDPRVKQGQHIKLIWQIGPGWQLYE